MSHNQPNKSNRLWGLAILCLILFGMLAVTLMNVRQSVAMGLVFFLFLVMLVFVVKYLATLWNTSEPQEDSPVRKHQSLQLHRTAAQAMQRAGHHALTSPVCLNDIGLLVYEAEKEPQVYRTVDIGTDATHIRPFIVIEITNVDSYSTGHGTIRFDILDEQGKRRFVNQARYAIKRGQNFVTPPNWLPIKGQNPSGIWTIQVRIGQNNLFAIHEFTWFKVGGELRAQFTGDGEIDWLAYDYPNAESLSLDDLLAHQGEEAPLLAGSRQ